MSASFRLQFVALLLVSTAPAVAEPFAGPHPWCGTRPEAALVAQIRHDHFQRQVELQRSDGRLPLKSAPTVYQDGQIAVLDDDGSVTFPASPFDLQGRTVQYLRRPKGVSAVRSALGFKQLIGDRLDLGDDDTVEVAFPDGFEFPFGDRVYTSVFVNSDGNVTFGEGEPFSPRDLFFFIFGPPRIAGLYADLNPAEATGENGVYVSFPPNRVRITWLGVPEFGTTNSNTFQITLFATGRTTVAYGDTVDVEAPIVGVAPFEELVVSLLDYSEQLPLRPRRTAIAQEFRDAPEMDELAAVRTFAAHFKDVYTTVFVWLDFPAVIPGFAHEVTLQNRVEGIGEFIFDITGIVPGVKNLESYVQMGDLSRFPDDPDEIFMETASTMTVLGHEFGHRWLAYPSFLDENGEASYDLLNFYFGVHWSFHADSEGSLMHGNDWQDNGDGTFSATTGAHTRYSPLDRYLMGLAPRGRVPDFYYIADPDRGDRGALPVFDMTVSGRRVDVSVDDVIAAEGRRRPAAAAAPKSFRTAFLLVGLAGQGVSQESIDKLERYRQRWSSYFREATGELGEVRTALFPR